MRLANDTCIYEIKKVEKLKNGFLRYYLYNGEVGMMADHGGTIFKSLVEKGYVVVDRDFYIKE